MVVPPYFTWRYQSRWRGSWLELLLVAVPWCPSTFQILWALLEQEPLMLWKSVFFWMIIIFQKYPLNWCCRSNPHVFFILRRKLEDGRSLGFRLGIKTHWNQADLQRQAWCIYRFLNFFLEHQFSIAKNVDNQLLASNCKAPTGLRCTSDKLLVDIIHIRKKGCHWCNHSRSFQTEADRNWKLPPSFASIPVPLRLKFWMNPSTGAFAGCKSLIHLELPNSVTRIDRDAFTGCNSLVSWLMLMLMNVLYKCVLWDVFFFWLGGWFGCVRAHTHTCTYAHSSRRLS